MGNKTQAQSINTLLLSSVMIRYELDCFSLSLFIELIDHRIDFFEPFQTKPILCELEA